MERVSFVLHIDPKDQAQYIERHQAVYPELLQAFGEVGIKTYSIFLHEGTLFAYMEVENYQYAMDQLAVHPANQRWQAFMADMLIPNRQGTTSEVIPEVFHYHA